MHDLRRRWNADGLARPAPARLGLVALALVAALLATGHGEPAAGAGAPDGRAVFRANCAGCHTLAAAGATGRVGPSLDQVKPSLARLRAKIPVGGTVMPAFARQLSSAQIEAVAQFVARATGGQAPGGPVGFAIRRHRPTGLSIRVPSPYAMGFSRGVYVLKAPGRVLTFSRTVTTAGADQYGAALLQQIGGNVVFRAGGPAEFAAQIDFGSRREAFVILRGGGKLTITTSSSKVGNPLTLETIRAIGRSAKGGVSLRAPAGGGSTGKTLALTSYRTPDGGATALVPTGWTVDGAKGNVYGSSSRGAFAFGLSFNIVLPNTAPGPLPPSIVVAPFMNAANALQQVVPQVFKIANVRIRGIIQDAPLPTFTSSAMFRFDYVQNGQPWTGVALVATDSPDKYGNLAWGLYYSGIGVPVGSDPSVGVGLLRSWRSWDPSAGIAAATSRVKEILNETNAVWKETAEFRSVTADRQARDVGCLLQGYYVIEDNSRKYDLPPLPCGQIYTERGSP